jgi:hypothetical protein
MTAAEQQKQQRIDAIKAQYPGQNVVVTETDNWSGMMATQISAMKRRGNLPQQYSYSIDFQKE